MSENPITGLRFKIREDGYKDYGDLSAVEPPYRRSMQCEHCKTCWYGCWDNFQCPECGAADEQGFDYV